MFLKFIKLLNGRLVNIIVPGDSSNWGWRKMVACFNNLVGKRFWSFNRGTRNVANSSALDKVPIHREPKNWGKPLP